MLEIKTSVTEMKTAFDGVLAKKIIWLEDISSTYKTEKQTEQYPKTVV